MDAKEIVTAYYNSDIFSNTDVVNRFVHEDLVFEWQSSKGFLKLDKAGLVDLVTELKKAYSSYRLDIQHLIADGHKACVRYTHYVNAIENPGEEVVLGYFVIIWEVKERKLYRGYLMSQAG